MRPGKFSFEASRPALFALLFYFINLHVSLHSRRLAAQLYSPSLVWRCTLHYVLYLRYDLELAVCLFLVSFHFAASSFCSYHLMVCKANFCMNFLKFLSKLLSIQRKIMFSLSCICSAIFKYILDCNRWLQLM